MARPMRPEERRAYVEIYDHPGRYVPRSWWRRLLPPWKRFDYVAPTLMGRVVVGNAMIEAFADAGLPRLDRSVASPEQPLYEPLVRGWPVGLPMPAECWLSVRPDPDREVSISNPEYWWNPRTAELRAEVE